MCGFILKAIVSFFIAFLSCSWAEGWTHSGSDFTTVIQINLTENATFLLPNVKYISEGDADFRIFCYETVPKSVLQVWRSVQLILLDIPLKYEIFPGTNETEVKSNYASKSIWHPLFMLSSSVSEIDFPAFSPYCVGISTKEKYTFFLKVRIVNYWRVLLTLIGVFLFLTAPNLSRNSFFHYTTGICLGILASVLVLLYIISRFIPQRNASYVVLLFGSSFVVYLLKVVWHYFNDIVTQYLDFVLGYCLITAVLSFGVCYRFGPVQCERTLNIIQWSMQVFSLVLIFFSSEYREVSTAIILLLLTVQVIPSRWIKKVKLLWYRCFPPKVKLLTELEFIEQGHAETKKALDNLRQYCNSPDCKVWEVVKKLKDPIRFADFIETGNHYSDQELLAYNSEEDYPDLEDSEDL